ncbi:type III toxin-antitoxin system TenpIN family toxin [Marinomonas sp.]
MLKVSTLTEFAVNQNSTLREIIHDKSRPHGIITIQYKDLTFAIPLRSNLRHSSSVVLDTVVRDGKRLKRGLDFTKALLIKDQEKEIGDPFFIPDTQKEKLISSKKMIKNQFERYVKNYVNAVEFGKDNTLNSNAYKFTTLINYHEELGLNHLTSD